MTFSHLRLSYLLVLSGMLVSIHVETVHADLFTVRGRDPETKEAKLVKLEARLAGSGQELHALEMADGSIKLIPQAAVMKREISDGPEPLDGKAIAKKLEDMFGEQNIHTHVDKPFVIGYIIPARLQANMNQTRIKGFLKKAHRFFHSVQGTFLTYMRKVRVQATAPKYPLVVLIFYTEADFEQYAGIVTGNRGLAAKNIAGFYHPLTNYLTLRRSECETFDTPLHESIHQQVFNRGIFQRLAPIPRWFNEGIATGFEGDGDRISNGPMKVNKQYAYLALKARAVTWRNVVRQDSAFNGDVFAGEAYGHAWGLHWFLLKKHKTKYLKYIQALSQKNVLDEEDPEDRLKELEEIVGVKIDDLQREFYKEIQKELKKLAAINDLDDGIQVISQSQGNEVFLPLEKSSFTENDGIRLAPGTTDEALSFGSYR